MKILYFFLFLWVFLPSWIRIRNLSADPDPATQINADPDPEPWFLSSRKYDPGCSSRIRILNFDPSQIPEPVVKKTPDPGSATLLQIFNIHLTLES
jgi:hypothetical protein